MASKSMALDRSANELPLVSYSWRPAFGAEEVGRPNSLDIYKESPISFEVYLRYVKL